ncbi:hypothetical protein [Paractinoplanes globisporus]|uniref:Uncharacterized protein n=1 Tax=Paractinoplanes globisporus TaxID=113565 RepID=A0ABW6WC74_9ACTN|nr:hypothetical protein [Actinoplanes globisporus]
MTASRRPWVRLGSVLAGVALAASGLWAWHAARSPAGPGSAVPVPVGWARPAVAAGDLGQASGVTITRVAVTGGGGLVDLRFRVVDPDRAHALHDPARPPAVVDESSGLVVHDLLMNHEHTGDYRPGVTYYLVFTNPGNWVRRGASVTVLLGNAQVEHVRVV